MLPVFERCFQASNSHARVGLYWHIGSRGMQTVKRAVTPAMGARRWELAQRPGE